MIEQIQSYIAACEANLAKYQQISVRRLIMIEQIQSYIAACEANLAKYQQIEDPVERDRAVAACEGMLADFKALIKE